MKEYRIELKTRGGRVVAYVNADSLEEARKLAEGYKHLPDEEVVSVELSSGETKSDA
jgi:hypothetical protein